MKNLNFAQSSITSYKHFNYRILFVFLIVLFNSITGKAQDVLFSNYQKVPLFSNPAFVAFDNDFKIGLNFRGRTSGYSQGYNTPVLTVSCPLINQEKSKRWGGVGFSFLSDKSENMDMLKTTGAEFAFAYNIQISDIQLISASLEAGYLRREINLDHLTTGSQYITNVGFNPDLPNNETFTNENKGFLDLSTGIVWQFLNKSGETRGFVGFSAFHLNQPNISLNETDDYLPVRYGFQTGMEVFNNGKTSIFPDAGFSYQSGLFCFNAGLKIKIPFKETDNGFMQNASLAFSPRYLTDNMASIGLEFEKPQYVVSLNYDFCVSNRKLNSNLVNAIEICVMYKKGLLKKKPAKEKIIPDKDYIVGDERIFNREPEVIVIKDTVHHHDSINIIEKELGKKIYDPERRITFNYKSDKVEDEAKKLLDEIVAILNTNQEYSLEIEGHTDNIGDAESNKRHSLRRAEAIRNYMIHQGILPSRILVSGKGENKPIATNATEEGRAKNRRVEFRLYRVIK